MLNILATTLCVGAFIFLLVRFPAFRVVTIVLAFLGSAVIWWIIDRDQARRALAHQLIALEEVELQDLRVRSSDDSHRLTGLARNASAQYTLTELIIKVSVADCAAATAPSEDCKIVADGLARAHSPWRIPPRQTRDIDLDFKLTELPAASGELRWSYSVAQTRASLEP
jgi:hypothetical protein